MSSSLKHHQENPRAFHRPVYINASSQAVVDGVQHFLYMDIGKKLKIRDIGYRVDGESPYRASLSYLLELLEGKTLEEVNDIDFSELKDDHFISLALNLLTNAISSFYGDELGFEKMSGQNKEMLLCRCYGVTTDQIEKLILEDTGSEVSQVMQRTEATTGCGSCLNVVRDFIQQTRDRLQIIPGLLVGEARERFDVQGKRVMVAGLFPFELIPKINDCLNELEEGLQVVQLEGYFLTLTLENSKSNISAQYIEKYLFEKLKVKFQIVFS